MQVHMNRRIHLGPWGGGNLFVKAFHELADGYPNVQNLLNTDGRINPDVILCVGLENDGQDMGVEQAIFYKMYVKPECKVVLRVNENDARKGTEHMDPALVSISQHLDGTVFVSKWLQQYFNERGWACKNQTVIYNGVDQEIFRRRDAIPNDKNNIVAHHWSDNRMKGADIYEKLDEFVGANPGYTFTYIGRHKCDFKHTKVIRPLAGKALGEELSKYDVYVSASRFDPGPNHVLEALACGMPTFVHKDGGGAVEFAGSDHAYQDWDQLKQWLTASAWAGNDSAIRLSTWQECVQEYIDFLEATWKASP